LGEPGEGEAFGAFSGQSTISDPKKYSELNQEILNTSNYIHKLKSNVANIASDFVVSQEDPKTLNPKSVGRKIVSIADPDLDEQMKVIEKAGGVLPGIRSEEMERIGLNATKNYLSRQPDVPAKQQLLNLINSYESDFEERNYLTTWQRAKEKIGAQIYKDGNQVRGAWFGLGYPAWQLKEYIENPKTGLSDAEKKVALNYGLPLERKIIGTDIPTSGLPEVFIMLLKSRLSERKIFGRYNWHQDGGRCCQRFAFAGSRSIQIPGTGRRANATSATSLSEQQKKPYAAGSRAKKRTGKLR
jgi:hypothetical protein